MTLIESYRAAVKRDGGRWTKFAEKAARATGADACVACAGLQGPLTARLAVTIYARPPNLRRRDLGNLLKAPLDAMQYANVIADDEQIDDLRIIRQAPVKGGRLVVEIGEL